jgi:hypothetical protein
VAQIRREPAIHAVRTLRFTFNLHVEEKKGSGLAAQRSQIT